jgi:hypothetical protein
MPQKNIAKLTGANSSAAWQGLWSVGLIGQIDTDIADRLTATCRTCRQRRSSAVYFFGPAASFTGGLMHHFITETCWRYSL